MASNYVDLQVVADLEQRPGFVTFGVLYEGVFLPIAQQPLGLVAQTKRAAAGKQPPVASSPSDQQVAELQTQLDKATAEQQALTRQLAALQTSSTSGTPASASPQSPTPAPPTSPEPAPAASPEPAPATPPEQSPPSAPA